MVELVIAIGLFAILMTAVITFADQAMRMSRLTMENEQRNLTRTAFFEFMRKQFEEMPLGGTLRIETEEVPSHLLHRVIIQDAPVAFHWGGQTVSCQAMELETKLNRGGLLDLYLRYYENPIFSSVNPDLEEQEPVIEIKMLEDLWMCELESYSSRLDEWTMDWEVEKQMPSLIRLRLLEHQDQDPLVHHFRVLEKMAVSQ